MSKENQESPAAKESEENTQTSQEDSSESTLEEFHSKEEATDEDLSKSERIALDQKKRAEKAESRIADLQDEISNLKKAGIAGSMPVGEVNDEIRRLGQEYGVDESFLIKLVSTVESSTKQKIQQELEKDYNPKLAKIEQERQMEKLEKRFSEVYKETLKNNPEYKGLANKDVIKALAFNPINAKKTLPQLLEEAYGGAIQNKKSIESAHASREPQELDVNRVKGEEWNQVESDPTTREKWAKSAEEQIRRYL